MSDRRGITWAVAVKAPPEEVQSVANGLEESLIDFSDPSAPRWEYVRGNEGYQAVIDREAGAEGNDEELAERLSAAFPSEVYLMRFREDLEAVWIYRNGELTGEDAEEGPSETAKRLGLSLDSAPGQASDPLDAPISACYVEGIEPPLVAEAVGVKIGAPGVELQFAAAGSGTVVWGSRAIPLIAYDVSEALDVDVFVLVRGPAPDRFVCQLLRGGEDQTLFEVPFPQRDDIPVVGSVRGAGTPRGILEALGVPGNVLGWS